MLYDDLIGPQGTWLCHHGVKGQKWGIRHDREKTSRKAKGWTNIKKDKYGQYATELFEGNKKLDFSSDSIDALKIATANYKTIISNAINGNYKKFSRNAWVFDEEPYSKYSDEDKQKYVLSNLISSDVGANIVSQGKNSIYCELFFNDFYPSYRKTGKYNYDSTLFGEHSVIIPVSYNNGKIKTYDYFV